MHLIRSLVIALGLLPFLFLFQNCGGPSSGTDSSISGSKAPPGTRLDGGEFIDGKPYYLPDLNNQCGFNVGVNPGVPSNIGVKSKIVEKNGDFFQTRKDCVDLDPALPIPLDQIILAGNGDSLEFLSETYFDQSFFDQLIADSTFQEFSVTQSFDFTGATQTFTVPAGVFIVGVQAWGAGGGSTSGNGGAGGYVHGMLILFPGQTITVLPGGAGQNGADFLGASGGGASVILVDGQPALVAGGGGGAASSGAAGGAGGGGTPSAGAPSGDEKPESGEINICSGNGTAGSFLSGGSGTDLTHPTLSAIVGGLGFANGGSGGVSTSEALGAGGGGGGGQQGGNGGGSSNEPDCEGSGGSGGLSEVDTDLILADYFVGGQGSRPGLSKDEGRGQAGEPGQHGRIIIRHQPTF